MGGGGQWEKSASSVILVKWKEGGAVVREWDSLAEGGWGNGRRVSSERIWRVTILQRRNIHHIKQIPDGSERRAAIQLAKSVLINSYLSCRTTYTKCEFLHELAQVKEMCHICFFSAGNRNVDLDKQPTVTTRAL